MPAAVQAASATLRPRRSIIFRYLPPHYYVETETGKESEIGSPWIMVESAVLEAIETVKKNKNHQT